VLLQRTVEAAVAIVVLAAFAQHLDYIDAAEILFHLLRNLLP
jgi:hypothetical protein